MALPWKRPIPLTTVFRLRPRHMPMVTLRPSTRRCPRALRVPKLPLPNSPQSLGREEGPARIICSMAQKRAASPTTRSRTSRLDSTSCVRCCWGQDSKLEHSSQWARWSSAASFGTSEPLQTNANCCVLDHCCHVAVEFVQVRSGGIAQLPTDLCCNMGIIEIESHKHLQKPHASFFMFHCLPGDDAYSCGDQCQHTVWLRTRQHSMQRWNWDLGSERRVQLVVRLPFWAFLSFTSWTRVDHTMVDL